MHLRAIFINNDSAVDLVEIFSDVHLRWRFGANVG